MELTQIPKIELHLHLDGAVPPETMWRMAQEKGLALPANMLEDFRTWLVRTADCRDVNTYLARFASADKGTHGFSRGKTTSGVVILVGGRQPACLVCLAIRRLSSVKNSEGLADRSGALSARQRTQAC